MVKFIWRHTAPWALAAGIVLAGAAPAQGAVYRGIFDPAFGNGFTGLGWEGEVTFEVPDACLALGSASFANVQCQSSAVQAAEVRLYNLFDPLDFVTLDFFGPQIRLSILDINVTGGTVVGLDTEMLRPPFGPGDQAFPGDWLPAAGTLDPADVDPRYALYLFGLTLAGDEAFLSASATVFEDIGDPGEPDIIDPNFGCPYDGDYAICDSATRPKVTFTRLPDPPGVPEPGTLALAAAALLAAGALRRRRGR